MLFRLIRLSPFDVLYTQLLRFLDVFADGVGGNLLDSGIDGQINGIAGLGLDGLFFADDLTVLIRDDGFGAGFASQVFLHSGFDAEFADIVIQSVAFFFIISVLVLVDLADDAEDVRDQGAVFDDALIDSADLDRGNRLGAFRDDRDNVTADIGRDDIYLLIGKALLLHIIADRNDRALGIGIIDIVRLIALG